MTPLIFLDTETTGLQPDRHTVWDVAWTTAVHDTQRGLLIRRRSFEARVPLTFIQRENADPVALTIGRYDDRGASGLMEKEAVIAELTADVARIVEGTDCKVPHLVGAVPSFDHTMLCRNWLGWPGFGEGLWHYHLVDVEVLAAGRLMIAPPYNSSDLTTALGVIVDQESKHTAMGDVRWAVDMYAAVYDLEVV
jgi:oligoribonuclease (3'-5' exoribonuclease)